MLWILILYQVLYSYCGLYSLFISRVSSTTAGPWNVVAFTAVGAYMGSNWSQWEDKVYDTVNSKRISVGYKPIERKESP